MNTVKHKKELLYLSEKWNCSQEEALRKLCMLEYEGKGYPSQNFLTLPLPEVIRVFESTMEGLDTIKKGGYKIHRAINLSPLTIIEEDLSSPLLELFE